ncbi:MAG TPA: hypothetical protein VIW94_08180 [Acidimicrobiia bacterium]
MSTGLRFDAEPLVFGVIGPRSARGGATHLAPDLRVIVDTDRLAIMSNHELKSWHSGSARGWYWSPISDFVWPRSWDDVQDEAMAPGIADLARGVLLHNDRLGIHELYYVEQHGIVWFSNWLPRLVKVSGASRTDISAWASIILGFPNTGPISVRGDKEPSPLLLGARVKRFGPPGTRGSP